MPTDTQLKPQTDAALPRYLCDRHLQDATVNPAKACLTWVKLIKSGNQAFAEENLELANQNFGAAHEIARCLIRNNSNYSGQLYAAERWLISAHNLSVTLARQNRHPIAGELLIRMHRELLVICNDDSLCADTRAAAYSCLESSLERIRPFLERAKDKQMGHELESLTLDVHREGKVKIFH